MKMFTDECKGEKFQQILDIWHLVGKSVFTEGVMKGLPKVPEYYYRLTGEWKGWADWYGVDSSEDLFEELAKQDKLEEMAFSNMWHE